MKPGPGATVLHPDLYPGSVPHDSTTAEALRKSANDAYAAGNYDEALRQYSASALHEPRNPTTWSNRSATLLQLDQAEDAYDDAERCLWLDPSFGKGYLRRGAAEWRLGRRADARASYEAGLKADPGNARLAEELARCQARADTEPAQAARAAVYRTMLVSPSLDVEGLFEMLQSPDRLTAAAVTGRAQQLDALLEYLCRTLECDVVVLRDCAPLREAYDRATFACGQLLGSEPGAASRLACAPRVVDALRHALRCGWRVEPRCRSHGVAKFAANALAVLASSPDALDAIRRRAARHLLSAMTQWLLDATPEPSPLSEDVSDESDGEHPNTTGDTQSSSSENRQRSRDEAARRKERQRVVCGCAALAPRLSAASWLERLFERGTQPWVRDECTAFRDAELLALHLCVVVRDERAPPLGLPGVARACGERLMRSTIEVDAFVRPGWRWDAAIRVARRGAAADEEDGAGRSDAQLARQLQRKFDDEAVTKAKSEFGGPPAARLGEWLAASLGYLLLFVDGDDMFCAHACGALAKLASVDAQRVAAGVWCGMPLLEKLAQAACKEARAVSVLEALTAHGPAREAMLSLAAALAGDEAPAAEEDGVASPPWDGRGGAVAPTLPEAPDEAAAAAEDAAEDDASAAAAEPTDEPADDAEGRAPTPSWADYFHELRGTLGIGGPKRATLDDMVLLSNFDAAAAELPVSGELKVTFDDSFELTLSAVPASWNERFADAVSTVEIASSQDAPIGSEEWTVGAAAAVLVDRSHIRKSPKAPDWATAVQIASEAGAAVVVVVNDLFDDGLARPAFRMGVFGASPPPIGGFMISGGDGDKLRKECESRTVKSFAVSTVRNENRKLAKSPLTAAPLWPLRGVPRDASQAWALAEVVDRAAPSEALGADLRELTRRMTAAEKRVWLARRLQRYHRPLNQDDEQALAFVECDRHAPQLAQLRVQRKDKTGLFADDVTGDFEVRFKNESAVGSAVAREWMDLLARRAFIRGGGSLLQTNDGGRSFAPNPAALFGNPHWEDDFEALGRLFGVAVWQQVTLDLPLHSYVCACLLNDGEPPEGDDHLDALDPQLAQSMAWIANADNDVDALELDFTDGLNGSEHDAGDESDEDVPVLKGAPRTFTSQDILGENDQRRAVAPGSRVELGSGGSLRAVTAANRSEFVGKVRDHRLRASIREPLKAMARGLRVVMPSEVLHDARRMLSPTDFCRLLSGLREVDVADWKKHTRYAGGLLPKAREVRLFWSVVEAWAKTHPKRLHGLLQFATGSRRVPVGGFAHLVGLNGGRHPFTLHAGKHLSLGALPTAHACVCTIDVPVFADYDAAAQKLAVAVDLGTKRFDEHETHESSDDELEEEEEEEEEGTELETDEELDD